MMDQCISRGAHNVAPMPKTADPVDVLKRVLDDHNVNQSEFALESGVSYVTLNRWLNRRTVLTEKKLVAVLVAVGIDPVKYGLDARKLPRQTTADMVGQVLAEMAAMEERSRLRHDEVMKALGDVLITVRAQR